MKLSNVAVCGCIIALSAPAVAVAASAKAGGEYSNQATLQSAIVAKNGKTAKLTINPGACAAGIPMLTTKPAKITGKKIKYSGAVKGLAGTAGTLVLSGTFTSRKALKWTGNLTVGSCHTTLRTSLTLR